MARFPVVAREVAGLLVLLLYCGPPALWWLDRHHPLGRPVLATAAAYTLLLAVWTSRILVGPVRRRWRTRERGVPVDATIADRPETYAALTVPGLLVLLGLAGYFAYRAVW